MKKPTFSLNQKDEALRMLTDQSSKVSLAQWALACAERVLPYFVSKFSSDSRPQRALESLKNWIDTGDFSMKEIRAAALAAHAAARDVGEDSPARSAARAAGQAVSTAHVKAHALGAALYAQQAIFRANIDSNPGDAVLTERDWQYQRLLELGQ
jgi:hypothetical protein